jgi:drug/metabolite transporter (DMT)-like permease
VRPSYSPTADVVNSNVGRKILTWRIATGIMPPFMNRPTSEKTALSALLLGATAIGLAPIFVRLSETGSTATAFWRIALALPALWLWMHLDRRRGLAEPKTAHPLDWPLVLPGLFFAADLAVWHVSILWTSVANATLLANFAPIFVALVAWLWFKERLRWMFPVGLIAALAGAAAVMQASFTLSGDRLRGDLMGLLTAVFYAGYQLCVKRLRATRSTGAIMFWSGVVSAGALLMLTLALGEKFWPVTARGWLVLVALALISHVAGQGLIAWALAHLPASFGSVSLLWQPVFAACAAWLAFGESPNILQAFGGAAVLAGIVLARLGSQEAEPVSLSVSPPSSPATGSR